jgi:glycosyltransferase involved in cell wall biosynthesis
MYHGNLAASALRWLGFGSAPVIWNIRQSLYGFDLEKRGTARAIRASAWLSSQPAAIIYNSKVSADQHEAIGFNAHRRELIPNGFDCVRFRPDPEARLRTRKKLGLAESDVAIGLIARYHPMKDHRTFLSAAALLEKTGQSARYLLAGRGVDRFNTAITDAVHELGLGNRVMLLGERPDIPEIMASLDMGCLTSAWGEGFPNVIGEAMACGIPVVTTDIGDSSWIVADTGRVVAPGDPTALARAWQELIALGSAGRAALGGLARARIVSDFSLERVIAEYSRLYRAVLTGERIPCAA